MTPTELVREMADKYDMARSACDVTLPDEEYMRGLFWFAAVSGNTRLPEACRLLCDAMDGDQDVARSELEQLMADPRPSCVAVSQLPMRTQVLAWLGHCRDRMRPDDVSALQDILGVPKEIVDAD